MEILSIGQKIKRARIYKGYTLKQICDDKFSVSKMSCIENDKIKAENWILKHIAKKLDLNVVYLTQDVEKQLRLRLEELKINQKDKDYEEKLRYNLKVALEYGYYNIGIEMLHLLFNYYIDSDQLIKCGDYIYRYYEVFTQVKEKEKNFLYHLDIANLFYANKEFEQALNYYRNVMTYIEKNNIDDKDISIKVMYKVILCYVKIGEYVEMDELSEKLFILIKDMKNDSMKAKIYHIIAIYKFKKENDLNGFYDLEKKSYEFIKSNLKLKAEIMYDYASIFFKKGFKDKALNYVQKAVKEYPKNENIEIIKFIILNIQILIENELYDKAYVLTDKALDDALKIENNSLVEKIYYYKAKILQEENNLISAEMYMNLSLDVLLKVGTKDEIYKRYLEMGNMYHKLNNLKESIKYFILAMAMEDKL